MEVYNGDKTTYIIEQLKKIFRVIENTQAFEQKIGVSAVPQLLMTFDSHEMRDRILEYIQKDKFFMIEGIEELIYCAFDEEIWEDFKYVWRSSDYFT
ncbi:MAG: hypothetical protein AAFO07_14690 [Bacteroidota bacterium]